MSEPLNESEGHAEEEGVTHAAAALRQQYGSDGSGSAEKHAEPPGSFLVLGNLLQISSLMLTHTQTPI